MNQVLLGASIPFVIALAWYAARRFRAGIGFLVLTPVAMGLCALWAVIPDIPRLLGRHGLYGRLARDPRMDVFFWHYTIDAIEVDSSLYHAILAVMGGFLILAAWRELRRVESERRE